MYIYICIYICIHSFQGNKNIYTLGNSFRRCLLQLHYLHKTNAAKTYTI